MKLENEHVLGVQTPPRKSYNPFDSDDEIEDSNDFLKSNINGYDIKSFETNADSLTFHLDSSDLSWEEAILSHSQVLSHAVPADSNGGEVLFRKDTELFTDKTVTECELPELMVCYKENAYHSVKDIGIDEGVPAHDKVSLKCRDNHHGSKTLPAFLGLNSDINGNLPHGDEQQVLPFVDGFKTRSDNISEKDASSQKCLHDPVKESGLDTNGDLPCTNEHQVLKIKEGLKSRSDSVLEKDASTTNNPHDSVKDGGRYHEALERQNDDLTNVVEFEEDLGKGKSTSSCETTDLIKNGGAVQDLSNPQLSKPDELNCHKLEKENAVIEDTSESSTILPIITKASTMSTESPTEEATSSQSTELPASEEPADTVGANAFSYNSKVESGSIILDFNSSTTAAEEEKEKPQQTEAVGKPPDTQTMSRHAQGPPGSILDIDMDNRVHGETSFSAAMPPPASITFMGPHAHIGSISLRSESSAGSTRSFAFPVLQAEWNTSPVRMAKAEQRNFRKQRGWVHSVMCCRF